MWSESFTWFFVGWMVLALAALLITWGVGELVAWSLSAVHIRSGKAPADAEDSAWLWHDDQEEDDRERTAKAA